MTDHAISVETTESEDAVRGADAALAALADERRRTTLSELLDARGRTSIDVLATRVAAAEADVPVLDTERHRDVAVNLRHRHLPKLDDAGLIDLGDGGVVATDRAERIDRVLAAVEDVASPDAALEALADSRRRSVVASLDGADGTIPLDVLTARVAAGSDDDRDGIAIDLHHRHLPKLDDAGLVAYDAEERRVEGTVRVPVGVGAFVAALGRSGGEAAGSDDAPGALSQIPP